jgi:hypothetical protein
MAKQRKDSNIVDLIEPAPDGLNISRTEWAATPEEMRNEIWRMFREFAKGFDKYRDAAQRDASLNEFHDLAAASGKKLKDVIGAYISMENLLRQDTVKGIEMIAMAANFDLRAWAVGVLEAERDVLRAKLLSREVA